MANANFTIQTFLNSFFYKCYGFICCFSVFLMRNKTLKRFWSFFISLPLLWLDRRHDEILRNQVARAYSEYTHSTTWTGERDAGWRTVDGMLPATNTKLWRHEIWTNGWPGKPSQTSPQPTISPPPKYFEKLLGFGMLSCTQLALMDWIRAYRK